MMETKNLAPWNWFKHPGTSASTMLNTKNLLWDYSDRNINNVFDDFVKDFGSFDNLLPAFLKNSLSPNLKVLPRIDISANEKEYVVEADLPGVKEEDLDIAISKDGLLTIRGKRESLDEQKKRNYYRMERSYGSFERTIVMPSNCDNDKIVASFKDGSLLIKIPKEETITDEVKHISIANKKS